MARNSKDRIRSGCGKVAKLIVLPMVLCMLVLGSNCAEIKAAEDMSDSSPRPGYEMQDYELPDKEQIEEWIGDGSWERRKEFMDSLSINSNAEYNQPLYYMSGEGAGTNAENKVLDSFVNAMPTIGNVKVPVFLVEFSDVKNEVSELTPEAVKDALFDTDGDSDKYPYESIYGYYNRSSYGNLNISGDVYGWITLEHSREYYAAAENGRELVIEEIIRHCDDSVDFSSYDSDNDGYMDGLYILYAGNSNNYGDFYWAYQTYTAYDISADGVKTNVYLWMPSNVSARTAIHETGHMLGLKDYYDNAYFGTSGNCGELGGIGFFDMMGNSIGDMNIFSKMLLGWVEPVFITEDADIELYPVSDEKAQAIIVTNKDDNNIFSEYYILELFNNEANNYRSVIADNGAVRIYHVDAETEAVDADTVRFICSNDSNTSEFKLIRIMESDGKEDCAFQSPVFSDSYYYEGMTFGPNTAPSSEFYGGEYTGIQITCNKVSADKAEVSVRFVEDNQGPQYIDNDNDSIFGYIYKYGQLISCFDSYVYEGAAFDNIKLYKKDNPDQTVEIRKELLTARDKCLELSVKARKSNYNQVVVNIKGELEPGVQYILEYPENALCDAAGNPNKLIQITYTAVPDAQNVIETKELDTSFPADIPEKYIYGHGEAMTYQMMLRDGTLVYADIVYSDSEYAVAWKLIAQDGQVLGSFWKEISMVETGNNGVINYIFELENGNICLYHQKNYYILDRSGNIVKTVELNQFTEDFLFTDYHEWDDCVDFFNKPRTEKLIYRISKSDGSYTVINLELDDSSLYYFEYAANKEYTDFNTNGLVLDKMYGLESGYRSQGNVLAHEFDRNAEISLALAHVRHIGHQYRLMTVCKQLNNMWTGMRKIGESVGIIDEDLYPYAELSTAFTYCGFEKTSIHEIEDNAGYIISFYANAYLENVPSGLSGSEMVNYIFRLDENLNILWAAAVNDIMNFSTESIKSVVCKNGKVYIYSGSSIIVLQDSSDILIKAEKSIQINGLDLADNNIIQNNELTIAQLKNAFSGSISDIDFYDADINLVTDDNAKIPGGIIKVTQTDGLCTWYYRVKLEDKHVHRYSTAWTKDAFYHWRECLEEGCDGTVSEKANHTAGDWIIDREATLQSEGSRHKECTTCGYVMVTETIPKLVQTTNAVITDAGLYMVENTREHILIGVVATTSEPTDIEYRWSAKDSSGTTKVIQDWTLNNEWLNWTPDAFGEYTLIAEARVAGNTVSSKTVEQVVYFNPNIKGKCQLPYAMVAPGQPGYLIGVETYENPNQEYQYEMLILNCTSMQWVYSTGKFTVTEGAAGWCVWQPEYGYYWTLFRVYDKNGNMIDQACYGFVNAY